MGIDFTKEFFVLRRYEIDNPEVNSLIHLKIKRHESYVNRGRRDSGTRKLNLEMIAQCKQYCAFLEISLELTCEGARQSYSKHANVRVYGWLKLGSVTIDRTMSIRYYFGNPLATIGKMNLDSVVCKCGSA